MKDAETRVVAASRIFDWMVQYNRRLHELHREYKSEGGDPDALDAWDRFLAQRGYRDDLDARRVAIEDPLIELEGTFQYRAPANLSVGAYWEAFARYAEEVAPELWAEHLALHGMGY